MKKPKKFFRSMVEQMHSIPQKVRLSKILQLRDMCIAEGEESGLEAIMYSFLYAWFNHSMPQRKVIRISTEGVKLFEYVNSLSADNVKVLLEEYIGKTNITSAPPIIFEFDEVIDIDHLIPEVDKVHPFNELMITLEAGMMNRSGRNNNSYSVLSHSLFQKFYLLATIGKLTEIIKPDTEGQLSKLSISFDFKIIKKISGKHCTHLWNYSYSKVTEEVLKRPDKTNRPIDFAKREEVVLERKPHYRRLRNGELRFFSGIKAKYYKLKDDEKIGTIVKI